MHGYECINLVLCGLGIFAVIRAFKGLHSHQDDGYRWFWAVFALLTVEYTPLTLLAMFGVLSYPRDISTEALNGYFQLVLLQLISIIIGLAIFKTVFDSRRKSWRYPSLTIKERVLGRYVYAYSLASVLILIGLQSTGYVGYFMKREFLSYGIPVWIDPLNKVLSLGMPFLLLVALDSEGNASKRVGCYLLMGLWVLSGFLSGFKGQVFVPIALVTLAGWMVGRLRWELVGLTFVAMIAAYSVIEPLRTYIDVERGGSVFAAFDELSKVTEMQIFTPKQTLERAVARIDVSQTGVAALDAYGRGLLPNFTARLSELYAQSFYMTFVPRAFWSDKPLANLGMVLSQELYGNPYNSISPTRVTSDYIWGGAPALVAFGIITGLFLALASVLMAIWIRRPFSLLLIFVLALSLSSGSDTSLFCFVAVVRSTIAFAIIVSIGRMFGIVRFERAPSASHIMGAVGNRPIARRVEPLSRII